jgi:hypothetical protein
MKFWTDMLWKSGALTYIPVLKFNRKSWISDSVNRYLPMLPSPDGSVAAPGATRCISSVQMHLWQAKIHKMEIRFRLDGNEWCEYALRYSICADWLMFDLANQTSCSGKPGD